MGEKKVSTPGDKEDIAAPPEDKGFGEEPEDSLECIGEVA